MTRITHVRLPPDGPTLANRRFERCGATPLPGSARKEVRCLRQTGCNHEAGWLSFSIDRPSATPRNPVRNSRCTNQIGCERSSASQRRGPIEGIQSGSSSSTSRDRPPRATGSASAGRACSHSHLRSQWHAILTRSECPSTSGRHTKPVQASSETWCRGVRMGRRRPTTSRRQLQPGCPTTGVQSSGRGPAGPCELKGSGS